jgi:hypothetical protein
MNSLSITELLRSHAEQYQRVAWFLIEWTEREQRVALRSPAAWTPPVRAFAPLVHRNHVPDKH